MFALTLVLLALTVVASLLRRSAVRADRSQEALVARAARGALALDRLEDHINHARKARKREVLSGSIGGRLLPVGAYGDLSADLSACVVTVNGEKRQIVWQDGRIVSNTPAERACDNSMACDCRECAVAGTGAYYF